jgi:hypothetical protein
MPEPPALLLILACSSALITIFPPTKTIYAVEWTTGDILKWVVGESTTWEIEIANADLPALLTGT